MSNTTLIVGIIIDGTSILDLYQQYFVECCTALLRSVNLHLKQFNKAILSSLKQCDLPQNDQMKIQQDASTRTLDHTFHFSNAVNFIPPPV